MTGTIRPLDRIDRAEVAAQLSRNPVLRLLDRPALDALLDYAQARPLRARARLFAAGDPGSALYLVLNGWLKLGELAVLCDRPRAADAVALSACRVLAIDGRALVAALRAHPDALLAIVRLLGERLARTTAQLEDGLIPAEPRLARTLLRLAALDPRVTRAGAVIDLGLSQSDLGELTGLARESINKLLRGWRDAGWIRVEGRIITLGDLPALRAVAEEQ